VPCALSCKISNRKKDFAKKINRQHFLLPVCEVYSLYYIALQVFDEEVGVVTYGHRVDLTVLVRNQKISFALTITQLNP
jgi:hypothetical protein